MDPSILVTLAAAALAGFFAAAAGCLRTFGRTRLADLLEERGQGGRLETILRLAPDLHLTAALARSALNLVVLLAALHLFDHAGTADGGWPLMRIYAMALLLAGALVWVFSVAVPVSIARYYPEKLIVRAWPVLNATHIIMRPVMRLFIWIDPLIRRITGAEFKKETDDEISDQIMSVVEEHHGEGNVDEAQKQMLEAVFDFKATTAGEIMTPRTDVDGIEVGASLEDVRRAVIDMGHSRIPVYEESLDHIVGVLYAKDLLAVLGNGHHDFNLRKLVREAMLVPETKAVSELLAEFKTGKVHIAIVLDEYGGTAGLVTIEDILEELVGEIEDEYEDDLEPRPTITRIDDNTIDIDARVYVSDLNDELDLDLPEDEDYDTVGGFVFSTLGHIPDVDESFEFDDLHFTVTAVDRTRVHRVRLQLAVPAADAARE